MKLEKIILLILSYILITLSAFGYINISPTTLDKNIGKGAYEEFTLYNNTNIPMRYKIEALALDNKTGEVKNMDAWAEIYPKVVNVKPAENKSFKVYVKAPKGTAEGDYGMFLNIRQVSAPKLEGELKDAVGAGMMVMTNLNMGIYGYVGDKAPKVETTIPVIETRKDGKYLKMDIENKSNRLVRIKIEAGVGKNIFYPIGETRILKDKIIMLDHKIQRLSDNVEVKEIIITDTETKKIIKKVNIN